MPAPLIWIAGLALTAWGLREGKGMFVEANKAAKYAAIGGGLYVSYTALKATGALK